MKNRAVRVELFHVDGRTDRRTDMRKLIVAILKFANASKTLGETTSFNSVGAECITSQQ